MQVDTKNPPGGVYEHNDTTYYFCGAGCRNAFMRDPESYLSGAVMTAMAREHEGHHHGGGHAKQADVNSPWSFEAVLPKDLPGYVDVEYQCPCGCRPGARYQIGAEKSGSEHCCCGRVHFAGVNAEAHIHAYMDERAKTNMDEDVAPYVYKQTEVVTPDGARVPVAYAQPMRPRK
jgi:YHS domain-containing protein